MKVATIRLPASLDNLRFEDRPEPAVAPGMVKVRWRALSLNFHDYVVAAGLLPTIDGRIPISDAAGEIVDVGSGVNGWNRGDRVMSLFFPEWFEGAPTAATASRMGGDSFDGCATEFALVDPQRLTRIPSGYSYAEAATLPCAALTAWRALVENCRIKPGDRVLVEGSGGMSMFVLQFAKLAGAIVYATSSSEEKCARLRQLGADHTVNYKTDPNWGETVYQLAGDGVDHVVDVGGAATLAQSFGAARINGNVVLVGILGGFTAEISIPLLLSKQLRLFPIAVGNRAMQQDMVRAIEASRLKPVIDSSFPFAKLADAFRYQLSGAHFGKIVIDMNA